MRGSVALACAAVVTLACSRRSPPSPNATLAVTSSSATPAAHELALASASALPSALVSAQPMKEDTRMLPAEERTLRFDDTPIGRMSVVVLLPERRADAKWPVLITMHGRGEALKGPERGARGWIDDYDLLRALRRVRTPPLTRDDFKGFVKETRRAKLNSALAEKPFRGFIIVCPYTPDMLTGDDPFGKAGPLAAFLVDVLLPRIYRETPAIGSAETTAIDGVSLGGRAAISVGLLRPQAFGVISSLQAAFHSDKAVEIAERARQAREKNPKLLFRILTSDEDVFLGPDTTIANSMRAAGVPVQFDVVVGPHDYDFNRGPGAFEMLLFHDRVLRGEPAP